MTTLFDITQWKENVDAYVDAIVEKDTKELINVLQVLEESISKAIDAANQPIPGFPGKMSEHWYFALNLIEPMYIYSMVKIAVKCREK